MDEAKIAMAVAPTTDGAADCALGLRARRRVD
jgi:hypothetical protein